jgi:hypothetical protein
VPVAVFPAPKDRLVFQYRRAESALGFGQTIDRPERWRLAVNPNELEPELEQIVVER